MFVKKERKDEVEFQILTVIRKGYAMKKASRSAPHIKTRISAKDDIFRQIEIDVILRQSKERKNDPPVCERNPKSFKCNGPIHHSWQEDRLHTLRHLDNPVRTAIAASAGARYSAHPTLGEAINAIAAAESLATYSSIPKSGGQVLPAALRLLQGNLTRSSPSSGNGDCQVNPEPSNTLTPCSGTLYKVTPWYGLSAIAPIRYKRETAHSHELF